MKLKFLFSCFVFSVLISSSCTSKKNNDHVEYLVVPNNSSVAIAKSILYFQYQDYYYEQMGDMKKHDDNYQEKLISGPTPGLMKLSFVWNNTDVRLDNGWNNWRDELAHRGVSSFRDKYYIDKDTEEQFGTDTYVKKHYQIKRSDCTSPPAYLHLILDSLNDFSGVSPSKSWAVTLMA